VAKEIDSAWRKEFPPLFPPLPNVAALPKMRAMVYSGPYNSFDPLYLTAFRNSGTFNPFSGPAEPLLMIAPGAYSRVDDEW
jgi:hypothetical protein